MGIFERKDRPYWMMRLPDGRHASTGVEKGPETRAQAEEAYRMVVAGLAERESQGKRNRKLTVDDYFRTWTKRRLELQKNGKLSTAKDEVSRLRIHAMPVIGKVPLREVRPLHVRELMDQLRVGTRAPRTQLHVYRTLSAMFTRAKRDELIDENPCNLERNELPKKVDAKAGWRTNAVFTRAEVVSLITDDRIPEDRRLVYAIIFLTGARIGEVIALRWSDIDSREPLDRITYSRAWNTKQRKETSTKTKTSKEVPVHPTLRGLLDTWWRTGWRDRYGRAPEVGDLVVPQPLDRARGRRVGGPRTHWSADTFRKRCYADLERLGLRRRSPHDGRATFISLTVEDGCAPAIMEAMTHAPPEQTARDGYHRPSWSAQCQEMLKYDVDVDEPPPRNGEEPEDVVGGVVAPQGIEILAEKMEPAGIEPASENAPPWSPTCVAS